MKQLNFFRKFMPSLIVYYLYLMVNETSYLIVKTFTRLHIYRSSSPSDKRGWGRGEGAPFPLRVSSCPKNKVGPGYCHFLYTTTYRRPPPPPLLQGFRHSRQYSPSHFFRCLENWSAQSRPHKQ